MNSAKHVGHQVIAMMDRLGVAPLTRNYHLFYTCIANSDPILRQAVRSLGRFSTQGDLDQLIEEFCPEAQDSNMMRKHENGVLKAIEELTARLLCERSEIESFNSAIERVADALSRSAEQDRLTADLLLKVAGAIGEAGKRRVASGTRVIKRMDDDRSDVEALRKELLEVKKMANTDTLTGLANRRCFDEKLATMISKSSGLALILIDIDHFKHLNDSFGHPFGDQALKGVAAAICRPLRTSAFVARVGGEEFAVILNEIDGPYAMAVAERVRACVANLSLRNGDKEVKLTVSLGVALASATSTSSQLYEAADLALYRSKYAGRNRVTCYAPEYGSESSNRYQIYSV